MPKSLSLFDPVVCSTTHDRAFHKALSTLLSLRAEKRKARLDEAALRQRAQGSKKIGFVSQQRQTTEHALSTPEPPKKVPHNLLILPPHKCYPRTAGVSLRKVAKRLVQVVCLAVVSPAAALCGFGRIRILFDFFAHSMAVIPGAPGNFLRAAFYKFTLSASSIDVDIWFGTFFSRRGVTLAPNVSIGSYCVLAEVDIGPRTQIASHVQVPGRQQHSRDPYGRLSHSVNQPGEAIRIGADCWIGSAAIIMADVGDQSTIGAGSVVVKPIPAGVVAVGVPARPLKASASPGSAATE